MLPTVAIIMSVYKADSSDLFDKALSSLLDQDYEGEIRIFLCVDGPIPQMLEDVLSRYHGYIFTLLRNEKNIGLARSLNRLLAVATDADFVFRMDSDDMALESRVSEQIRFMQACPQIDILGTAVREVDLETGARKEVYYPTDPEKMKLYIARRNPLAHPTVCFRRSALDLVKQYPTTSINQDWALWFQCLSKGLQITNLNSVHVEMHVNRAFYKRRGGSRAKEELLISLSGIRQLLGYNWRLIFPILRYVMRYMPSTLIRALYNSAIR